MNPVPPEDLGTEPDRLFLAIRAGYQALGRLLEQHRDYLLKIINEEMDPRLVPRQGTSDVVQDVFVNILKNIQGATEGFFAVSANEDLKTWLRRVGLNALKKAARDEGRERRDFRRDQAAPEGMDPPGCGPGPGSVCRQKERDALLTHAINALPEADRVLLRLHEWNEWTYTALAGLLDGEESDSGRMRVQRRLTELRFRLGDDESLQELKD
jgi:RNA polymerase sigma factor (sigma-70 family)